MYLYSSLYTVGKNDRSPEQTHGRSIGITQALFLLPHTLNCCLYCHAGQTETVTTLYPNRDAELHFLGYCIEREDHDMVQTGKLCICHFRGKEMQTHQFLEQHKPHNTGSRGAKVSLEDKHQLVLLISSGLEVLKRKSSAVILPECQAAASHSYRALPERGLEDSSS